MTNPNGVAIKDIPGVLVEMELSGGEYYDAGFAESYEKQGNVRITLNRENLAGIIWIAEKGEHYPESEQVMILEQCYRYADAILADQKDLFERVE